MNKREMIEELYASTEDVLFADGLDEAIIGFAENEWKVVYSKQKCVDYLHEVEGMDLEDAIEFLDYNTFSAYVGSNTPIWVDDLDYSI
jgi:hypothetical protein